VLRHVLFGIVLSVLPLSLAGNTLIKAYVEGDRLLLRFAQPITPKAFRTFRLLKSGTVRYVFDIAHTRIGSTRVPLGLHHRAVTSFRISQYQSDTVRIVVQTQKPYHMIHGKRSSHEYYITLPKQPTTIKQLFSDVRPSEVSIPHRASVKLSRNYTVILDPGHGGHDTGAIAGGKREKDVVLQIAKRVRKHLETMGVRVLMTRDSNRFVPLRNRTRYANQKRGDVFVSIHANAIAGSKRRTRHGVETFFLQTSRSERAKRVAERENSVVLRRSDRLSKDVILNAVMTGPKIVLSNKLAIDVQRHILGNLQKRYRDVHDGGVRSGHFWVLVGAEMPAVLVEVGYISYPKERKRLFNSHYQDILAKGIAEGVVNYLRVREQELE